jgi:hypothetical protein
VKCNRKHPCDTCTSHGYAASCAYPKGSVVNKQPTEHTNVIFKLNHLESLVTLLMNERHPQLIGQPSSEKPFGQAGTVSGPEAVDALPNTFGRLSLDQSEASYVGSDHWAAIIDGVSLYFPSHSPFPLFSYFSRTELYLPLTH